MDYSVVMEDDLLKEFYAFKHGKEHDTTIIEKLLNMYKPYKTTSEQLKRIGVEDTIITHSLLQSGFISQTLEELAQKTIYKIILSSNKNHHPYVNIYNDSFSNYYTISYKNGEVRTKLHSYLSSMFSDARQIWIYDKYLSAQWDTAKQIFDYFPKRQLNFFIYKIEQKQSSYLKNKCNDWQINNTNRFYTRCHDRYILIDKNSFFIEIIITSGIDYIFDTQKEVTLIIKHNMKYPSRRT